MFTRREFTTLALSGLLVPLKPDTTLEATRANQAGSGAAGAAVNGVRVGAQTYSFRALPRPAEGDMSDALVKALTECGLRECELWSPQLEPAKVPREQLRSWRLDTPLDHFSAIRKKFNAANITIRGFNYSFNDSFTEPEIDRGFEIARALGAEFITASSTLSAAKRVAPFAEKHRMVVAMHNHSNLKDPNEFATPESFATARKLSQYFMVNLDIGHFTAANFDAVAYIREHHATITNLHIKDRKRNQGDNMPWGEGDTPIREVLQLLRQNKWPIAAYLEYEYKGAGSPVDEVKKGLAFVREALS
ncbi:MAG: sugar phosphate isomerase/epimerase [Acidobacteria bacterium]|nr:MAG: sugar phosphate isomerase/epimerase [Acidobacteriota bacterium]